MVSVIDATSIGKLPNYCTYVYGVDSTASFVYQELD
ncbi:Uncharacterised protein [Mycobacteroides abscessus subsp. bolletii]|nr:Uncharacterised protein [Mycobacteroides abscessus subsp. bolletii]SHS90578.1 Uncharacterised protein [Mycobacteroides abscessus subsp. bolletii]SHT05179.1 Uncharacterised protein [Mycobacteroides abscessus subsp. bolletii]SHT57456.1 Uncharacterised protein [Mycobacteroides abscessus subsp. bolletii]SHY54577.1 Uncharacterised protein [Mycobacteroides abscessus subsp. bolletii]